MILLDIRTIVFSNVVTDIVCMLVILLLWHQSRKRFAGMGFWVFDYAFQTVALFLIILRGSIPDWMSMVLSNTLVIAGALLGYVGLGRFVGKKSSQVHNYVLLAVFACVHTYFTFVQPNLSARNLNVSVGLLIICFQCMWLLVHRVEAGMRQLTLGVGIVFGAYCLVSILRIVGFFVGTHAINDFFRSGAFQSLILIFYQMLFILLTYSLSLMFNKRLLVDVKTQEEKFFKAFHSSPYAITLTRLSDGQIIEVNDGFVDITGYQYAEIMGKTMVGLQFWDKEEDRVVAVNELSKIGKVQGREFKFRKKSGEMITGLFSAEIIQINNQEFVLSSISDITERKRVEEVLKDSEERYRTAIEHSNDGVAIVREDFHLYVNQKFLEMFGYNHPEEIIGKPLSIVVHPDDRDRVIEINLKRQKGEDVPSKYELKGIRKNGDIIYVEISATKTTYRGETVSLAYLRDITERKRAEEVLRESEEKYRTVLETIEDGYFEVDITGNFTFFNDSLCRMLGYTKDELMGMNNRQYMDKETVKKVYQVFNQLYTGGEYYKALAWEIIRKDGTKRFHDSSVSLIRNAKGEGIGFRGISRDVTERKQVEEKLSETRQVLVNIALGITDGIFVVTKDFKIIWANEVSLRMAGCKMEELVGNHCYKATHHSESPCQPPHDICPVREVINTGNPVTFTHTHFDKEGNKLFVEVSAYPVKDEKGEIIQFVHLSRDITERRRAEEALRESEKLYRTLIETSPDAILLADTNANFIMVNQMAVRLYGYQNMGEMIGKTFLDHIPPEERPRLFEHFKKTLQMGNSQAMEHTALKKDGSSFPAEVNASLLVDTQGKPKGTIAIVRDITERKRAEKMLGASEERYRTLFEGAAEGILVADIESKQFKYVNPATCRMLGYTAEELTRLSLADIHPKEALDYVVAEFEAQARGEKTLSPAIPCLRKDGSVIYTSVLTAPVVIDGRKCNVGFFTDITERKRAEEALRESEERSRSLIETSPDMIALIDFSGKIIVMNGIALTTYGYESKDELIGKSVLDFVIPEDRPRVLQEISKVLEVKTLRNLEYTSLKKDGSTFSIEVSASLILDAQQKPTSIVIMIRNITERKRATAELVNLNKQLEAAKEAAEAASRAKGEFLANMSHEIRTPLNAVIGMLGLLSTSELNGPHRREYVEIARSSADGLLFIINDILDFSKIEAGKLLFEPVAFDLLSVVEETIDMMVMKTREKGLDLTVQYGPDVPRHFIGDSGRIRQVLINLVNNAIKFTHKGHVLIEVRAEEQMNEEVLLRITVEDTGIGISSDTLDSLFKPFVQADASTTRRYGGTGLGLAISKRLVETMGGTIGASSRSGEGSAFWFTLCLPLDKQFTGVAVPMAEKIALHPPAESGATQTALPKTAPWGRPLRVLVVEDNVVNQRVTMLMLTELGCHVDLAANGREAVEMIELLPFDMVFMDCEMPEMDGFEATREIRRLQGDKHLPIIAMTAYALQGDRERCLAAGMDDYFSKPVKLEDFQAALERWGPKDSRSFEGRLKPPASLEKAPLTVENETSSVIDPNVIARLRGLADATDPSLLTRIFHLFLSDTPERITTLREAAATGDTAGLSKAAHSLRGACASIGVMGMAEICKTLESLGHGKYVDGAMALVEKLETEFNQVKVEIEREIAPSPPPSPLEGEEKGEGYSVKDRDIEENDQNEDSHFGR